MKQSKEAISILLRPQTLVKLRKYHHKYHIPLSHIIDDALLFFFQEAMPDEEEEV